MALYNIQRNSARGRHMLAAQALTRGTCVLAETPLIEINVGRSSRFNNDDYWGAGRYSGGPEVNMAYARLNANEKALYDQLKVADLRTNAQLQRAAGTYPRLSYDEAKRLSRAHNNSFERRYTDADGVEHTVFTMLSAIASINHACKPNAIYQWDDERPNAQNGHGQGVIHALQPIAAGEEITLCYPSSLEFMLKSRNDRRAELNETWKFRCMCPACRDTSEDALRQTVRDAHTALVSVGPPHRAIQGDIHNPGAEMQRHRELHSNIESLTQFIAHLKALEVKDIQLADTYKRLAEFHEGYWNHGDRTATHAQCLTCEQHNFQIMCHPRYHLDQALLNYREEMRITMVCCGRQHADVRKIWDKIEQLEAVRPGCNSPVMPP